MTARYRTIPREGTCYICEEWSLLQLDHCHTTGKCRGFLCRRCNIALGFFEKHPNHDALVAYSSSSATGPSYEAAKGRIKKAGYTGG